MPDVTITPVETGRQQRRFLSLPWQLYRDMPQWVPPLWHTARRQLGFARHPFYERARSRSFLATPDGLDVGRVTAIVNDAHNDRHQERLGFFGFFECADDSEAARALFDAAQAWLAAEGMTAIRGPANPSLNYECGLLVDGFHLPPQFMMTYNHRWYERLILENGFAWVQDLFAFWGTLDMLATLDPKLALFAEIDRKPVGACFCLLDYNPRIKAIDGRLFPFCFLRLLANRRAITSMRAMTTNVVPEYQAWGMREVEFSWVLESNHLSRRTLERGGALKTKTYRLYQSR
jgi:hypothetical protein